MYQDPIVTILLLQGNIYYTIRWALSNVGCSLKEMENRNYTVILLALQKSLNPIEM